MAGGRAAQCCPRCHFCLACHDPSLTVLGAQSTASRLLGHVLGSLTQKRRVKTVAECRRAARARFSWRGGCRSVWDGGRWASVTLAVGICFSLATSERRCSPAHMLSGRQRCFLGHLRASEGTVVPRSWMAWVCPRGGGAGRVVTFAAAFQISRLCPRWLQGDQAAPPLPVSCPPRPERWPRGVGR